MRIELLWSGQANLAMLKPNSLLAQALLYADSVIIMAPESDDLLEHETWWDLQRLFPVDRDSLDSYLRTDKEENRLAGLLALEGEAHIESGRDLEAFRTGLLLTALLHDRRQGPLPRIEQALTTAGVKDPKFPAFFRTNEFKLRQKARVNYLGDSHLTPKLVRLAGLLAFSNRATEIGSYALVDQARGIWTSGLAQTQLLSGPRQDRAAHVSLAVGSIARLPSIDSLSWDIVAAARKSLSTPLIRFRGAMEKLSRNAEEHPLDSSFDDFVEHVWVADINPALAELDTLTREGTLRSVFFDNVLGKLSTYAGPAFAIAGGSLAGIPLAEQIAMAAGTPLANALGGVVSKRRLLARHDYFFLNALEKTLRRR